MSCARLFSPRVPPRLGLPATLACLVFAAACPPAGKPARDSAAGPMAPEERFGNDPELVADFRKLSACALVDGRLDRACREVAQLRLRLEVKGRGGADVRKRLVTTLVNLLESRSPRTRAMVAEGLHPWRKDARLRQALGRAVQREALPRVKAMLLRQACWEPAGWVGPAATALLTPASQEGLRAEAAACLGRLPPKSVAPHKALLQVLAEDPSARVRARACEALGRRGRVGSEAALAAQLKDPRTAPACATALARLASVQAFDALAHAVGGALDGGRAVPQQLVRALTSFQDLPAERAALQKELRGRTPRPPPPPVLKGP